MTPSSLTDVSLNWPGWQETLSVMTMQAGRNSALVVLGATALGIAAGLVGTFALLRKRALMGDALAHSTLPGLALAFIFAYVFGLDPKNIATLLIGASISGILGVITVQLITRYSKLSEDTAIGAVLSCFFGAGVVLLSLIQSLGTGKEAGLSHFVYGQTAAMNQLDATLILCSACSVIFVCTLLLKEFRLVSFDPDFAKTQGWNTDKIDLFLMALVVLVIVVGLQAVGLLLIVALLVVPATCARFWTEKLSNMAFYGAAIGGISAYLGSVLSSLLPRLPAGAVIVLVAGVVFFFSFLFAPARGLIAKLIQKFRLSFNISKDHLLREIIEKYELLQPQQELEDYNFKLSDFYVSKNWAWPFALMLLSSLWLKKLIFFKYSASEWCLKLRPAGIMRAQSMVRNHRLWEEYLSHQTQLPLSHIDFSADLVEHVLSPELVKELENSLPPEKKAKSELSSLHPLEAGSKT
jgi:manganese/zinc/iron transport system permease protein